MPLTETNEGEIYQSTVKWLSEGLPLTEVKLKLIEMNLTQEEADKVVDNIQRFKIEKKQSRGGKNMAYGGIICIGGIIATAATEGQAVFYGAIGVGAIQFFIGLSQSMSKD